MAQPSVRSTLTAQDSGFISQNELVVGADNQGRELTHGVLADRLVALDTLVLSHERAPLRAILESGFRGYHNMSPGELWSEWQSRREEFEQQRTQGQLDQHLAQEDPLREA